MKLLKKKFYLLKDKKLRLIEFKRKHITKNYLHWLNSSKEIKYSRQRFSKHNYPTAIEYYNQNKKLGNLFLAIEIKKGHKYQHIGNLNLGIDKKNRRGHLSILLGENKGKGIGFLAWKKMIEIAFNKFNCKLVVAGTMKSNKAMFKIFKKCRMKIIKMPNYFYLNKKNDDLIMAYLSKDKN